MKYAHLADLHLGSWRDPIMRSLSTQSFIKAMDVCIQEDVDFIIFAGDLFNTSLPALDTLKIVTKKIKQVNEKNIPFYVIAGSHDFSPSGKTMIDVLENAGLITNVCKGSVNEQTKELHLKFTVCPKTQVKLTGILGRKGQLDQAYYQNLHRDNLENEAGYKIFCFHTTITELLEKDLAMIDSQPLSFLPKNFNYYAGGHIHHPKKISEPCYPCVTYTGALFPTNFAELEKYSNGGFYIITTDSQNTNQEVKFINLKIINHQSLILNCNNKSPEVITFEILEHFANSNLQDAVITIRLKGKLMQGRVTDINFRQIIKELQDKGAKIVMRNTAKLLSPEFEHIQIASSNPHQIEEQIINEHLSQQNTFEEKTERHITKNLLHALNTTKKEGETITDFTKRVQSEVTLILNLEQQEQPKITQ